MGTNAPLISRRSLIATTATSLLMTHPLIAIGASASQRLQPTPRQAEGPFYPVQWNGDIDNDLVAVTGIDAQAMGQVLHVQGQVRDINASPLPDAVIEIWQVDNNGVYLHPADNKGRRRVAKSFQGRGRTRTDSNGRYAFRTIRPVAYPGRTPHIHFRVAAPGRRALITQLYFEGEAKNRTDGLFKGIRSAEQRARLLTDPQPYDHVEAGSQIGIFNIVMA